MFLSDISHFISCCLCTQRASLCTSVWISKSFLNWRKELVLSALPDKLTWPLIVAEILTGFDKQCKGHSHILALVAPSSFQRNDAVSIFSCTRIHIVLEYLYIRKGQERKGKESRRQGHKRWKQDNNRKKNRGKHKQENKLKKEGNRKCKKDTGNKMGTKVGD